jgi:hypothetical protein
VREAGELLAAAVQQQHLMLQRQRHQRQVVADGVDPVVGIGDRQPPDGRKLGVDHQQLDHCQRTCPAAAVHQPAVRCQRQHLADLIKRQGGERGSGEA